MDRQSAFVVMEQPSVQSESAVPPPVAPQGEETRPQPPQPQAAPSASAPVDLRDSYVSLTVSPGFEAALEHLKRERQIAAFMSQFFGEYAALEQETAKRLQALAEGATARFERSFVQKAWLGIKTGQGNEVLQEIGTTQTAWQSVRESVLLMSSAHQQMGQQVQDSVAASLRAYLAESEEAAAKVETWGTRLSEAMANYVRRAEEAKNNYHSRARAARMASKILEEAEKQSQIGGITRGIILTSSRMDKMKEAAEKAKEDEIQSAQEYRLALELVAKKKNELYSIRLPRVMAEIQRLVEERTSRIHVELSKFVAAGKEIFPLLHEAFGVAQAAVEGVSPLIDTRVFVAQAMSNDSIPEVLEFVPFDAQSSQLLAGMDRIGAAFVVSSPPPPPPEESVVAAALRDPARALEVQAQLGEKDPVSASGVRFVRSVQEFRRAEGCEMAVEIYHTFLGEESVELLVMPPDVRAAVVSRIKVRGDGVVSSFLGFKMFSSRTTITRTRRCLTRRAKRWWRRWRPLRWCASCSSRRVPRALRRPPLRRQPRPATPTMPCRPPLHRFLRFLILRLRLCRRLRLRSPREPRRRRWRRSLCRSWSCATSSISAKRTFWAAATTSCSTATSPSMTSSWATETMEVFGEFFRGKRQEKPVVAKKCI